MTGEIFVLFGRHFQRAERLQVVHQVWNGAVDVLEVLNIQRLQLGQVGDDVFAHRDGDEEVREEFNDADAEALQRWMALHEDAEVRLEVVADPSGDELEGSQPAVGDVNFLQTPNEELVEHQRLEVLHLVDGFGAGDARRVQIGFVAEILDVGQDAGDEGREDVHRLALDVKIFDFFVRRQRREEVKVGKLEFILVDAERVQLRQAREDELQRFVVEQRVVQPPLVLVRQIDLQLLQLRLGLHEVQQILSVDVISAVQEKVLELEVNLAGSVEVEESPLSEDAQPQLLQAPLAEQKVLERPNVVFGPLEDVRLEALDVHARREDIADPWVVLDEVQVGQVREVHELVQALLLRLRFAFNHHDLQLEPAEVREQP